MFSLRAARLELELTGNVADAEHQRTTIAVRLLVTEERPQGAHKAAFVLGFDRGFWQDDVSFDEER